MTPKESQQTVEALAQRVERLIDRYTGAPWHQRAYAAGTLGAFESGQDARAALRDLAAQASRTQEWKQLAEDMGELLAELEEAVSDVLGTLNFYSGPGARTAVSRESQLKYERVKQARDGARTTLARLHDLRGDT